MMLQVIEFSKKYKGADDYSTHDISFSVPKGAVVGLLGKNGAGKSTTIKSICGIFPFQKGQIIIDKYDIKKDPIKAKAIIGFAPDDHSIYERLTGRECINYIGTIYGVTGETKKKRIAELAKKLDIEYALDRQISSYSHGMKQKICLIVSLIHNPKLWILDEPMLGLDMQTKQIVMDMIDEHAKKGNSVLFSSHDIYTVNKVCDYVGIIHKGRLVDFINMKKTVYNTAEKLEAHFMEITNNNGFKIK